MGGGRAWGGGGAKTQIPCGNDNKSGYGLQVVPGWAGFFVGGEEGADLFERENVSVDDELVAPGVFGNFEVVGDGVTVGAELAGDEI